MEHLLLALLDNNDAIRVLKACGADISGLRGDLVEFVDATTPLIPADEDDRDAAHAGFPASAAARGVPCAVIRQNG